MKKAALFFSLVVWCTFPFIANAGASKPEYAVSRIATSLTENASVVIRTERKELKLISSKKALLVTDIAITILSDQIENAGIFSYPTNKFRSVKKIEGGLYNANGDLIRYLKNDDIKDLSSGGESVFYSDDRVKIAGFNYGIYPYTVEMHSEETFDGFISLPGWAPVPEEKISCEQSQFTFSFNKILSPRCLVHLIPGKADTIFGDESVSYKWRIENVPALEPEPFTISESVQQPYIEIVNDDFEIDGYKGSCSSWKNFGKFYYDLNADRDFLPEECKNQILKISLNATTEKDKIKAIYNYLQTTTRYVNISLGIGGWQSHYASYVYQNKFGDCKALTNYMKSMLKLLQIDSYCVLINSGRTGVDLRPDFPANNFNHVILLIPSGNDTLWLECTSQNLPFNYLPKSVKNQYGLMIKPDGGYLIKTPSSIPSDDVSFGKVDVNILENGSAEIKLKVSFDGDKEAMMNQFMIYNSQKEQTEWISHRLNLPSAQSSELKFTYKENKNDYSVLTADLTTSKFGSYTSTRWFIDMNILNRITKVPVKLPSRKNDVYFDDASATTDTIVFHFPDGFRVENFPKDKLSVQSDFGKYNSEVVINEKERSITYIRSLQWNSFVTNPERYWELRDFYTKIVSADRVQAVLLKR